MKWWILLCTFIVTILVSYTISEEKSNENNDAATQTSTATTTTTSCSTASSKRSYSPGSIIASIYYKIADAIISKLVKFVIKKQKQKLEHEQPITYNFTKTYKIPSRAVRGEITIEDPILENVSEFELKQLESRKRENSIDFELFYPKLIVDKIKHRWIGSILDYHVKGNGRIDTETTNLTLNGTVQYHLVNMTLQIADLKLDYAFEKFKLHATGINIPFLSPRKVDEILTKELGQYLKNEEPTLSVELAEIQKKKMNEKMKEYTLRALLKKLWDYLTSWTKKKNQDEDKKTFDKLSDSLNLIIAQ